MRGRILVVDDTPENTALVARVLGDQFDVSIADSGEQALESALAEQPQLILLDIVMPGMDGYEACIRLKENPATRNIPVIFLTAKNEASDVVRGLKPGSLDYVTKPFNRLELSARVIGISELNRRLVERTAALEETAQDARTDTELKSGIKQPTLTIPSGVSLVTRLCDYLNGCYATICESHSIDLLSLVLCLNEALANAVIHGNLQVRSSLKQEYWQKFKDMVASREANPDYARRPVECMYQLSDDDICIEVADQGDGFDPGALPDPNDPEAMLGSGRGILLIRSFMDKVLWNESGSKITMTKNLN